MIVVLTGATGFIGSHLLTDLHEHGHEVTALVRDDAQADTVAVRGAAPVVVDLYDRPAVARLLGDADGAIHTASPGDATSADLDAAVTGAFAGTGRPRGRRLSGQWSGSGRTARSRSRADAVIMPGHHSARASTVTSTEPTPSISASTSRTRSMIRPICVHSGLVTTSSTTGIRRCPGAIPC